MISVIMPVYNEAAVIKESLSRITVHSNAEIIVVDGNSSDQTKEIAEKYPVKIVNTFKNKAFQCNAGADCAQGSILVFLHADCYFEKGSLEAIARAINEEGVVGGCLHHKINSSRPVYRLIESSGNIRAKMFRVFYGDQAIFIRRDIFNQIGGFDEVELFDDVLFSKKLRKKGKTCVLNERVYASARRWEKQGVIKATLINWVLTAGFLLKMHPGSLGRAYQDVR